MAISSGSQIEELLGDEAESLLSYQASGIDAAQIVAPGPDFIDRVVVQTDRTPPVLRNLGTLTNTGRLSGTGYISILPVDQGIEHSGAASFAKNPAYFDPQNLVELAIEGGCNAIATTFGVLGMVSRRYAHRIPFIVKLNHNELLTYPNEFDQVMFGSVREAFELGAVGVGATIYYGSENATRQIVEVSEAFEEAHSLGMFTVLWCYLRNSAFKTDAGDMHTSADLTGQANHLGVTHRGRHHQAEAAGAERRLPGAVGLRQDRPAGLRQARPRPSDRVDAVAGRQLLHGPRAADQLGRRVEGRLRSGSGRAHRRHQQAGGRLRADRRPQGVPAAAGRRRRAAEHDPGRLPGRVDRPGLTPGDGQIGVAQPDHDHDDPEQPAKRGLGDPRLQAGAEVGAECASDSGRDSG